MSKKMNQGDNMNAQPKLDSEQVDGKKKEKYQLGVQAFIWGQPLIEMYRQAEARTSGPGQNGTNAPFNSFGHADDLVTDAWSSGLCPNSDTLYSMAWLDLRAEPLVLSVPAMDKVGGEERYYVLPFFDAFNQLFYSIGKNTMPYAGRGEYLISGPDWKGEVPAGMAHIASPTQLVWILGRTFIDGPDDLENVNAIQAGYTLTPLRQYLSGSSQPPATFPHGTQDGAVNPMPTGLEYFATLSKLMKAETMPAGESLLWKAFERIDLCVPEAGDAVIPEKPFAPDPLTAAELERAASDAADVLDAQAQGVIRNGWMYNLEWGVYSEYFARSLTAWIGGVGGNVPEESVYLRAVWDEKYESLGSAGKYEIHFEELPPVGAFWSISMYGSDQNPVKNDIGRLSISDRTEGIKVENDGSLKIYIQYDKPGSGDSNWLPCPDPAEDKDFQMWLRAYMPAQEIIDLEYLFPKIRKVG